MQRTSDELDTLGFNVWRFGNGKGVKANRTLIAARNAGGAAGDSYGFVDRTARRGVAYTYRLQAVGQDSRRAWRASTTMRAR